MEKQITNAEKQALTELFLRGVSVAGMPAEITPESIIPILRAGLDNQRKFIDEMIENRTDRAKKAREVLTARVYVSALDHGIAQNLEEKWEQEAERIGFYRARNALGL